MSVTQTAGGQCGSQSAARWALAWLLGALLSGAALAQTTVTTIGGGPNQAHPNTPAGSDDGNTLQTAQFNTPGGLVLDISGRYLFQIGRAHV